MTPTPFPSVLYRSPADECPPPPGPPPHFRDLHLDQVVAQVVGPYEEYDLAPFFHQPLADLDLVTFRQEAMRDLEAEPLRAAILSFSDRMREMRGCQVRAAAAGCASERHLWLLDAARAYREAVEGLRHGISSGPVRSRALTALGRYLDRYAASPAFVDLATRTERLGTELARIQFTLEIRGSAVTVRAFADEPDYGVTVEHTFARFRRRVSAPSAARGIRGDNLNHVEIEILERVVRLFPRAFGDLEVFVAERGDYVSGVVARFEREVHFYLAYLTLIHRVGDAGLTLSYPELSRTSKAMRAEAAFDLALALVLVGRREPVVCNDYRLEGAERILVVSGPNQGGKTTFARMLGQAQYLASLGCPVPGGDVHLPLCDGILTHFERPEDPAALRGKLQDDLLRIRDLLRQATPWTFVILNEAFSSTTAHDALFLGRKVLAALSALDAPAVWVTFLAELASFDAKTVSVVGEVNPVDPAVRTFRLSRRAADGLAYAKAIAEKHGVTYQRLRERLGS